MNFEHAPKNGDSSNPHNIAIESEVLMETYETLLSDGRKEMENLRRELDILSQFENNPETIVMPVRNRQEIMPILKQVRQQLIKTQETLRTLREYYESVKAIIPNDPSLN